MTISKQFFDDRGKRENNKPSRPVSRAYHCRRLFAVACIALGLICGVPTILNLPEVHWNYDNNIKPPIITPAPADKASDMIAFICAKDGEYPRNRLYTIYPDGSRLRPIAQHPYKRYSGIKWSPDGIWIAMKVERTGQNLWVYNAKEIYRVRFDGLDFRRLTYNNYAEFFPKWSDDGGSISFVSKGSIHKISVNGHEISRFDIPHKARGFWGRLFAWSSDNRRYAFDRSRNLYHGTNPDWSDVRVLKEAENQSWSYRIQGLEWAPNNEQILYHYSDEALFVYNVKTKAEDFSVNMDLTFNARWSPDGNWIAIVGRAENVESGIYLYLLDVQAGDFQKVTIDNIRIRRSISWSPDSEWIAFSDSEYSLGDENKYIGWLFKIRRDGTDLQQLVEIDCSITGVSWSPK